jgi:hypothetical protein
VTCREIKPIVDGLERKYGDRITFMRANIHNSKNQDLMDDLGFSTTPYIVLVDANANVLKTWDETISADEVSVFLDQTLAATQ